MKLKKGDTVVVLSGKEKGKKGKIVRVHPAGLTVVVEGVNIKKKHRRPTKSGEKGQVIEKQNPIASGKVGFVCPACGKAVRLGYKLEEKRKVRVCKKCGAEV
ncbi:MAG: 50S ribosomal protein L24 [Candidatus Wildermuthbacteria bacterium RIFCSPHIGHO2_02_FULL_49_9]|uniref:Large ribosomal subunit protein uL24 n=2 Tax=Candidatus Wildermuthiibacteriota TaxID=1817923 RepID=A0A1G2QWP6_9BACT|nr:MAG: 50S ribosomal protein L24 [Candidatus Wildermuthbacteria bacterium RIFCSPHIGHO2_01_FULL_49_22b]OHA70074.1 MAG: 50S ribosomal protein L24 [Candidatus Wildermuthbacteria bacterium RIFCSPHIGHO2_02_FULL_49_9]